MAPPRPALTPEQRLAAIEASLERKRGWLRAASAAQSPEYEALMQEAIEHEERQQRRLTEQLSPEEYKARLRALTADQFRRYLGLVDEHGHAGALVVVEGEG